jgi:DNA-binding helix-hairpin-helix protein with protein kinase domain
MVTKTRQSDVKTLTCVSTGQPISLTKQIASSGEGAVWQTDRNGYLAKIYHSFEYERIEKLKVMMAHPPEDPNAHLKHISFAWPQELLKERKGAIAGFLMPAIIGARELLDVYSSKRRKQLNLEVDWRFLHTTALNIASIIEAIHAEGYVLGDIKPQNILVNNRALPSIIDTDSFQVCHPSTGQVYRCLVGSEGFTPVELLSKDFRTTNQTQVHDYFRLAVIIYLLLFGDKPFKGKWVGTGESPDPTELLRRGFWPYARNSLIKPGPHTIPLEIVHPEIQLCFLRCFNEGHTNPDLRPKAKEWRKALSLAIESLTICGKVDSHFYSKIYGRCYWCDRKAQNGVDLFGLSTPTTPQQPSTLRLTPPSTTVSPSTSPNLTAISALLLAATTSTIPSTTSPKLSVTSKSRFTSKASKVYSYKSSKRSVTSTPLDNAAILKWTVSTSLVTGGFFGLVRMSLGHLSTTLNDWVFYNPPEVMQFPFKWISPDSLPDMIQDVQWVCAWFSIFAIAVIIMVFHWRRSS